MKINKYVKLSNGMYKVILENKVIKLHEDLILKYELLIKKQIDEEELKILQRENLKYEAYNLAIKYITKKMRTKNEIEKYLKKYEIEKEKIDEVIDLLSNQGYINEKIYIDSFIHDRMVLSNDGPIKIRKQLQDEKLDKEIINEKLKIFTKDIEEERITKIINKCLKCNKKSNNAFKLKLKQDLINLGYSIEIINMCIEKIRIDDEENKKNEYEKLYKKYSKKYKGEELEYKIRQSLYQKGYR